MFSKEAGPFRQPPNCVKHSSFTKVLRRTPPPPSIYPFTTGKLLPLTPAVAYAGDGKHLGLRLTLPKQQLAEDGETFFEEYMHFGCCCRCRFRTDSPEREGKSTKKH